MSWDDSQKQQWYTEQEIKRSYKEEVLDKLEGLEKDFEIKQYGNLSLDPQRYPLYLLKSKSFDPSKKSVLITGGVHGYETSGVQGALAFCTRAASEYFPHFNIVCAPCVSPWGYETINRWNNKTIDPNRSFFADSPAEECANLLKTLSDLDVNFFVHFDLHETTDTDNTIFRPALAAKDGIPQETSEIPDGFYVVGDSKKPVPGFQKAIIDSVREVTHIAPADTEGNLIGAPLEQEGVVNYDVKKLFLCASMTGAEYTTTTEVYPDSPKATPEQCIEAQIAAIKGGLDFVLKN